MYIVKISMAFSSHIIRLKIERARVEILHAIIMHIVIYVIHLATTYAAHPTCSNVSTLINKPNFIMLCITYMVRGYFYRRHCRTILAYLHTKLRLRLYTTIAMTFVTITNGRLVFTLLATDDTV